MRFEGRPSSSSRHGCPAIRPFELFDVVDHRATHRRLLGIAQLFPDQVGGNVDALRLDERHEPITDVTDPMALASALEAPRERVVRVEDTGGLRDGACEELGPLQCRYREGSLDVIGKLAPKV